MGVKRIFISDIHMGDARSLTAPHPYVWFNNNVSHLANFLNELLKAPDVKEVIILGDLFDQWIIPANRSPIPKLETICSSNIYAPVIDGLKALAASQHIKLTYVPGNHDMAISPADIPETRQFFEDSFQGMNFICEDTMPLGIYKNGIIVAEHGNRYGLFNSPDILSNSGASFLPLGYFISRLDTYKVCERGCPHSFWDILFKFGKELMEGNTDFVEDVFLSTAQDCGLGDGSIDVNGLPGYDDQATLPIADIANRFSQIATNWGQIPGTENIPALEAAENDQLSLFPAAKAVYFQGDSQFKVVIFGHTHNAEMQPIYKNPGNPNFIQNKDEPFRAVYANSGTWIDDTKHGCTYVETEEDGNRLYVRVKGYPSQRVIDNCEGFVEIQAD